VTDRAAWTLDNSTDIEMAQGLSSDITTSDDADD
jgi:aldehyde dehydrogenase (NAD+)